MAMREKRKRQAQKEQERLEQERKLERLRCQVAVMVSRDPSRVLQPTVGWEERRRAGKGSGIGGPVLSMPKRCGT